MIRKSYISISFGIFLTRCKSSISLRSCELEKWKLWVTIFFVSTAYALQIGAYRRPYWFIGHKNWIVKNYIHRSRSLWLDKARELSQYAIQHFQRLKVKSHKPCTFIARKSALEKTQLSDVLITDNLFW